jgi:hypothetical protein
MKATLYTMVYNLNSYNNTLFLSNLSFNIVRFFSGKGLVVTLGASVLLATDHFNKDTGEDQTNSHPLESADSVLIDNNRSQNGKEFSGGGNDTEDQRREVCNSVEDKDLSHSTENSQKNQILNDQGVFKDELDESAHLESDVSNSQTDETSPLVETFHLVPLVGVELLLDFSLGGSEETVAEQRDQNSSNTEEVNFVVTALLLAISEVEDDDTSSDDETTEVLALGVLSLNTEEESNQKDGNDLGGLHDSLDGERNISEGLAGHEDGAEAATTDDQFRLEVHLGLGLLVVEFVDSSSQKEREKVLEEGCGKAKVKLLKLTLGSVQTRIISVEQSFHDEAEVDIRSIDTSDCDEELEGSTVKHASSH